MTFITIRKPKPCPKLYACPIDRIMCLRNRLHKPEPSREEGIPWKYIDGKEPPEVYEKGYLKTDEELYGKRVVTIRQLYKKGLLVRGSKGWEKCKEYYDDLKKDMNTNIEKIWMLCLCFEEPCDNNGNCEDQPLTPSEQEEISELQFKMWKKYNCIDDKEE